MIMRWLLYVQLVASLVAVFSSAFALRALRREHQRRLRRQGGR